MHRSLLVVLALACAAFDTSTGRTTTAERPLESMVSIPQGTFLMGASPEAQAAAVRLCREELGPRQRPGCSDNAFVMEGPPRVVFLSAFLIDRVEVTVEAYRRCVQGGACSPQPLLQTDARFVQPSLPVTSVTWDEAARYCAWRDARLPSEAEWERAARGRDGRTWPWGNVPRPDLSNHGRFFILGELGPQPVPVVQPDPSDGYALLAPAGSYPEGASPDGVLDLAGNAMEWTADFYQDEGPTTRSTVNPRGPAVGSLRSTRGGSWRQPPLYQRTTARDGAPPDTRSPEIGFRCAR
ncbi:MAG TPA: SUMF1/EgtB/PvdO family nonheme iron enzyme [Polyangia bacterium]|nr:SUMF1/EgtB/PvdO family nonheme iron enzyme [Polyangia bacterium]